jgi:hypothetical protein
MSMGPPPGAIQNLPVLETAGDAYRSVFGQLPNLARIALLPFMLTTVLMVPALTVGDNALLAALLNLLQLVPYTLFGVSWHRLVLLGPQAAGTAVFPGWQPRHWRFYGYALIITVLNLALIHGVGLVTGGAPLDASGEIDSQELMKFSLAFLAGLLILTYVVLRLSFVFPAVAVDEAYRLGHAWRHSRGQGLRLIAAMFVTLGPALLAGWMVIGMVVAVLSGGTPPGPLTGALAYLLMSALGYVVLALSLSVISTAFRTCTGWIPGPPAGPPARVPGQNEPFNDDS